MEKVSQLILDLMDKGVVTPRQASALMSYVGESGFAEERLSIVERLQARTISFDEAMELLEGLTGSDGAAERIRAEESFWKRRHALSLIFRPLMIVTLIVMVCTLPRTLKWVAEGLAQQQGGSELTRKAVTFIQTLLTIVLAPELALLWLLAMFALLSAPTVLLPRVFTPKGTYDKIIWLVGLLAAAALALMALWNMFFCDRILLQNMWLIMWIICLGAPPVAFFWVGHPKKRAPETSPARD